MDRYLCVKVAAYISLTIEPQPQAEFVCQTEGLTKKISMSDQTKMDDYPNLKNKTFMQHLTT